MVICNYCYKPLEKNNFCTDSHRVMYHRKLKKHTGDQITIEGFLNKIQTTNTSPNQSKPDINPHEHNTDEKTIKHKETQTTPTNKWLTDNIEPDNYF